MNIGITVVIVVFYLYLLVRPQHVKGPLAFRLGLAGVCLIVLMQFVVPSPHDLGGLRVRMIFEAVGTLVAYVAAMYSCRVPPLIPALEPKPSESRGPDDADAEA